MDDRQQLGRDGEDAAVSFLRERGMRVIARNWRCRHGEIDIVALDDTVLVFCEVKTRRGGAFGGPLTAVTPVKVARMRRLAALWLAAEQCHRGPLRLDVLGLLRHGDGTFAVEHIRGVS